MVLQKFMLEKNNSMEQLFDWQQEYFDKMNELFGIEKMLLS
jgi:hypothetical protein